MGLLGLRYKLNHDDAVYDQRDVAGYFRKKYSGSKQSKNTVVILATKGNEKNGKKEMKKKQCKSNPVQKYTEEIKKTLQR